MQGWIAISRDLWTNPLFKSETMSQREAWIWMIAEASHQPIEVRRGDHLIELQRGELVHSIRFLAETFGWSPSKVHRFVATLKRAGEIETRSETPSGTPSGTPESGRNGTPDLVPSGTPSGTPPAVIRICRYNEFQNVNSRSETPIGTPDFGPSETPENRQNETPSGTPSGTKYNKGIQQGYGVDAPARAKELVGVAGPGLDDPAKSIGLVTSMREILVWERQGCSFEEDVKPVVQALTAAPRPNDRIKSWRYFTSAILRARDERLDGGRNERTANRPHADIRNAEQRRDAWREAIAEDDEPGDRSAYADPGEPDRGFDCIEGHGTLVETGDD